MKRQRVKIMLGPGSRILTDNYPGRKRRSHSRSDPITYEFEGEVEVHVEDLARYVQVVYLPRWFRRAGASDSRYVYEDPFGDLVPGELVRAGSSGAIAEVVDLGDDESLKGSRKPVISRFNEVLPEEY